MSLATEQRLKSRIDIDSNISYCLQGENDFYQAELRDLSPDGAGIWLPQTLPLGSQLHCRAESKELEGATIEFTAILRRTFSEQRDSMYGYGCTIENVKLPECEDYTEGLVSK